LLLINLLLYRFCNENRPLAVKLLLDVIEEIMVLIVVDGGRWCLRCLPGQRLEAHEQECLNEASPLWLILRHDHNDAVHLQLILGELQERDEGLLGAGRRKVLRQSDIQQVVDWVQNHIPIGVLVLGHVQFDGDLHRLVVLQDLAQHFLAVIVRAQRMDVGLRLQVGAIRLGGRQRRRPGAGLVQAATSRVDRRLTAVA